MMILFASGGHATKVDSSAQIPGIKNHLVHASLENSIDYFLLKLAQDIVQLHFDLALFLD